MFKKTILFWEDYFPLLGEFGCETISRILLLPALFVHQLFWTLQLSSPLETPQALLLFLTRFRLFSSQTLVTGSGF